MFAAAATGAVAFAAWIYLAAARGQFWRVREEPPPAGSPVKPVAVVIPARNEAAFIGDAVRSLAAQNYAGPLSIFVVDDDSTDGTGDIARATCETTVIRAEPLPPGWTGKMWAVAQGVEQARAANPEYILLTDADVVHGRDSVRSLVARAEADGLDMASYMVLLRTKSAPERLMIPAFVFFFLKLYPPAWIAGPKSATAGAAGGCILIRRAALDRIGGIASIRGELIDDCALAARVKHSGGRIWMGLTRSTQSVRDYTTLGEIRRMIARTAFTQLKYSAPLLVGTVLGMGLIYIAPVALLFSGDRFATALAAATWFLMSALYTPTLRFYRLPVIRAPALPLVALFYTAATIDSAVQHYTGQGGTWKGRTRKR